MKFNKAISTRILNLCDERGISVNKLAGDSLLTQSTLENVVQCNYESTKTNVILCVCDGLGITVREFFDDDLFDNIIREY